MAAVVLKAEGKTKDGKPVKIEVTLKKFCHCKPTHPECDKEAQKIAEFKLAEVLTEFNSDEIFWLEGKINPNFYVRVMEVVAEILEDVCVTARSTHLQGAQLKVEVGAEV